MKQIKTRSGIVGIIEVPKLAFYFDWNYSKHKTNKEEVKILIYWETEDGRIGGELTDFTDSRKFDILNKLSELDKELEEFVDFKKVKGQYEDCYYFKDYPTNTFTHGAAYNSFISLIKSQHPEFDSEKEYLLIKLL